MIKFVLVIALIAAPALGSSIKGYNQRLEGGDTKGGSGHGRPHSPVEQQKLIEQAKGQRYQEPARIEQVSHLEQQKVEELKQEPLLHLEQQKEERYEQQREELPNQQKLEEPKGGRYEAKPQLSRDDLAKGQKREEKREESKTSKLEQQKQEEVRIEQQKHEEVRIEQQKQEAPAGLVISQQKEEKFDKLDEQQRTSELEGQIELKEEQRRLEESSAFVQPVLPLTVVEERIEQQRYDVKGGGGAAPIGEAEPYAFNYQIDGQSRSESGDTKGVVRGQYTLQGADGASRIVEYVADQNGFRASVNTNEFGTEGKSPASVSLRSSQPSAEDITLRLESNTKDHLLAPSKTSLPKRQPLQLEQQPIKGGQDWAKKTGAFEFQSVKGQKLTQQQQQQEEPAQLSQQKLEQPAQKGSLPELSQSLKFAEIHKEPTRSFESATAHREYRQPATRKQAPGVLVRQLSAAPVVRPSPASSRSYPVQSGRVYPPSPVAQQPPNPRVSFYSQPATGPVSYDEDISSFVEPSEPEQA